MIVGLVVEYCCHGRNFLFFVDARLIPSMDNTVVLYYGIVLYHTMFGCAGNDGKVACQRHAFRILYHCE